MSEVTQILNALERGDPQAAGRLLPLVYEELRRLADVWRAETGHLSSTSDLVAHPAFPEIIAMGPPAIPFLLRELETRTGHWHRALRRITGADPVAPADRGDVRKAAEAWLR